MSPSRSGRSILYAYAGIAVPAVLGLMLVPLLVRRLGPERFGLLSLLLSLSSFLAAFDFGIGTALSRYVSRFDARPGGRHRVRRLVEATLLLQLMVGTVVALGLLLFQVLIGYVSGEGSGVPERELFGALVLLALSIPFALVGGATRCALEGLGRFGQANALRVSMTASSLVVPVLVSLGTGRLDVIMSSLLGARLLTTAAFIVVLARATRCRRRRLTRRGISKIGKVLAGYGGWVTLGVAFGSLITLGVLDRFLISRLVGPSRIIDYSVPSDVIIRCLLAPGALASVMIPTFAKVAARAKGLAGQLTRSTALLSGQMGPVSLLLILNAEALMGVLMPGHASPPSVLILQAMAFGLYYNAVAHVPYAVLHALGRPAQASGRHVVELPIYGLLSFALLRHGDHQLLGVLWAAWALGDLWLICYLLSSVDGTMTPRRVLGSAVVLAWSLALLGAAVVARVAELRSLILPFSVLVGAYWVFKLSALLHPDRDVLATTDE